MKDKTATQTVLKGGRIKMKKELRKVYENIKGERLARLKAIEWQYPTREQDPVRFRNGIGELAERLIEKSNFGEIMSEAKVELMRTTRSVAYGNGADMDIKEYGLVEYAENFFEKNLKKFGKAEVKLEARYFHRVDSGFSYGTGYCWKASFEPNKS